MDQTEQIIEALKDAGVKAEQVLTDALPVLLAETRALGLAYVIGGCIAVVFGTVLCWILTKHCAKLMDNSAEELLCFGVGVAAGCAGALAIAGVCVGLTWLKLLMAPTLYLVERLL